MKTVNALYGIEKLRNLEQKEWETMHRILIIEDDFSLNNTLAYNLRTAGYTVDSAYNAKEAFISFVTTGSEDFAKITVSALFTPP